MTRDATLTPSLHHPCGNFIDKVFQAECLNPGGSGVGEEGLEHERFRDAVAQADVFVGSNVGDPSTAHWVSSVLKDVGVRTCFARDCSSELDEVSTLGEFRPFSTVSPLVQALPNFLRDRIGGAKSGKAKDRQLWDALVNFYERNSSEDLTFLTLVLVDT